MVRHLFNTTKNFLFNITKNFLFKSRFILKSYYNRKINLNATLIKHYFPELSKVQEKQFIQLQDLYEFWNKQINIISRKDIDELYIRHVLHSLAIAKFIEFKAKTSILDIGTGGGFPGIPLAILFPKSSFHLVDSMAKKIKVVQAISAELGLVNITSEADRAEKTSGEFDFIVSRAVAPTRKIWQWTHQKIKTITSTDNANGIIALKGGDLEMEMKALNKSYQEINIRDYFNEPFFETKKIIYIPL